MRQPEAGAEADERREALKTALIGEGLADLAAGRLISFEAVSAWIDSWGADQELPRPEPGR